MRKLLYNNRQLADLLNLRLIEIEYKIKQYKLSQIFEVFSIIFLIKVSSRDITTIASEIDAKLEETSNDETQLARNAFLPFVASHSRKP